MIPRLDAGLLAAGDGSSLSSLGDAATGVGFATVHNTALTAARVTEVIETYRAFFHLREAQKRPLDMARTGSNRGWGAPESEQVDPDAYPDYKQFFDIGFELPADHPLATKTFYAPNIWPADPRFRAVITAYYTDACAVALDLLRAIARAIGADADHFDGAFGVGETFNTAPARAMAAERVALMREFQAALAQEAQV